MGGKEKDFVLFFVFPAFYLKSKKKKKYMLSRARLPKFLRAAKIKYLTRAKYLFLDYLYTGLVEKRTRTYIARRNTTTST